MTRADPVSWTVYSLSIPCSTWTVYPRLKTTYVLADGCRTETGDDLVNNATDITGSWNVALSGNKMTWTQACTAFPPDSIDAKPWAREYTATPTTIVWADTSGSSVNVQTLQLQP